MADTFDRLKNAVADRYAIQEELGAGGMATVYLAEDLKHHRKVAVKVLRPELAAVLGAERFVKEIETTANLQHPHILPLFDSGEADSFLYYVMPFIDGETVRDKLNRETQLGIEEAVGITTDIADALDYAHRNNVIHRDIKPENILLHDGRPMVADFGIALAVSAAAGGRMTETGMSLGTPHYMSPEQATAEKDITHRSDIYSLGSVLYEMLTGEPPHSGGSAQAIIMKIVTDQARTVTELRKSVPPHVAAATAKSLEKLAADRFESAAKFAEALGDPRFRHGELTAAAVASATAGPWKQLSVAFGGTTILLGTLALWMWTGRWSASPDAGEITRLTITLPHGQAVTSAPAISPDGQTMAFTAATATEPPKLYTRELDEFEMHAVVGSEGAEMPFFSPDGQSIAFFANGRLFRWNRAGGVPQPLADAPYPMGGTWGEDDTIVFVPAWNGGLYQIRTSGGGPWEAEPLLIPDEKQDYAFVFPRFVPRRPEVLFASWGANAGLWRIDLAGRNRSMLIPQGNSGTVTTSGHLLYALGYLRPPLLATPQPNSSVADAPPLEVLSGVHQRTMSPDLWVSVSNTGTLAYVPSDKAQQSLVRVDALGGAIPVTNERGQYGNLSLSPNGSRVAANVDGKIWLYGSDGGRVRLAPENRDWTESSPAWGPDGLRVLYSSNESGNWEIYSRIPGSSTSEVILQKEDDQNVESVANDGTIAFRNAHPKTGDDIWLLSPDGTDTPWQATEASEAQADFSPDGRWLAYASNVSGRFEIYMGRVGGSDERFPITTDGGQAPIWSPKGDRLFYRRHSAMMAVEIVQLDPIVLGRHQHLFDGGWSLPGSGEPFIVPYDVAPDGEHFIMIRHEPEAIPDRINIVTNWFEELKARVGN